LYYSQIGIDQLQDAIIKTVKKKLDYFYGRIFQYKVIIMQIYSYA